MTASDVHDTRPVPDMLARVVGRVGRVYGDGAYAGGPTHRAVAGRRQALPNAEGVFRPGASVVRAVAQLDPLAARGRHARHVAREGRAAWERMIGYGRRDAAEWTFSRLERALGAALRARSLAAQRARAAAAARALNRMAELGMPRAQRVAWPGMAKRFLPPTADCCTKACALGAISAGLHWIARRVLRRIRT